MKNPSMKSMTGFGYSKEQSPISNLEISVRSVNGRFLEPRFHLPKEFMAFESSLRAEVSRHFQRGTIDVFITRKIKPSGKKVSAIVNEDLVRAYHKTMKSLQKKLKLAAAFHVETFMRLPEVLTVEEENVADPEEEKVLLKALAAACAKCQRERVREGKDLRDELLRLLGNLEGVIGEVSQLRQEANQQLQQRFETKIKARAQQIELDPQRISQEILFQLEKADIDEELTRLKAHLKNYRDLLVSEDAVGKKLDFYTQELLREANTIGSKSNLSRLTQLIVEVKTLIEKLREQVQNIE